MVRILNAFALAAAIALAPLPAAAQTLSLTIVHVGDWDRMEGRKGAGGAARIAAVVAEERARAEARGGHAIVTFGGDMISPSLMSGIDKGAHMVALADAIGFDIGVVGNHEFDFGTDVLRRRLSESRMTWLAGNVRYKGERFPGAPATAMLEKDGFRLGVLGLVTADTPEISKPGEDVTFAPVVETGVALAKGLKRAGADLVVALTHDEVARDMELLGRSREIDILLGGHDHLLLARYDGRQAVMKAGSQGNHVAVLDLEIERRKNRAGAQIAAWTPSWRLRSTAGLAGDAAVAARVAGYRDRLDRDLGAVIGETRTTLDTRRVAVRAGETAFGNFVADAMRRATGSDIALLNGGGVRGDTVYPAGTAITRKLVLTELPFGNRTVKLRLTGAQLKAALESGVSQVERAAGRFPQVSGIAFAFDLRRPAGARIARVAVGGEPLDPRRSYTLATVDFLASGGDGYGVLRSAEMLIDARSGGLTAGQVIERIAASGTVAPAIEGRIVRQE
ncbi:MAG: 5'-nucleotidase C-terminal domain-containing protein [Defluviicoccus sp.]|nr:5'-nucleotidase C-terminal domain-containing protein [Defluviicoccus sp.]MDE0383042.1 5'-nucleotidase C-terminal domain-containing protein [Defluviicoccus sp.]